MPKTRQYIPQEIYHTERLNRHRYGCCILAYKRKNPIFKFSNSLICSLPILARATDLSMHTTAQPLQAIRYSGYTYARPSIHALLYGRHTHIPKCWHNSSADANTRDTRPFRTSSIAKSNSVIYATDDSVSITTVLHSKTHQVSQGSILEKQSYVAL